MTIATRNLRVESHDAAESGQLDPGDYVVIEVVDTGVGIPEAIIGRVRAGFTSNRPVEPGTLETLLVVEDNDNLRRGQ